MSDAAIDTTSAGDPTPADDPGASTMSELPPDECYALLRTHEIGRLGVNAEQYPLIIPVNYVLDGTDLVIRTHPGTVLQALSHANVTFEVDEIDRRARSGWSVLLRGVADEVGAAQREELVARAQSSAVEPWAPGEHGNWMRITTHDVTGRRIVPGELPPPTDPRGYL